MGIKLIRVGVLVVVLAVGVGVYLQRPAADTATATAEVATELPRLLDLGADKCIPCKMMAPILVELETEFAEVFAVQFIDVWKDPEAAKPYGLKVIPTQIFFAADGTELFRHEGFYGREDILGKWRELGVALPDGAA